MFNLTAYGWDSYFESEYKSLLRDNSAYGRVLADYGQKLRLMTTEGELLAIRAPQLLSKHDALSPAVGDWVLVQLPLDNSDPMITKVLPRKTKFSRAAAGIELKEQVVAANMDYIFLIQSLNENFNLRRLERYLIASWESGAQPIVVLTKSDIGKNTEQMLLQAHEVAKGVEIIAVSALTGDGLDDLKKFIQPGKTIALLGSSGVGKSTLINRLAGHEILKTQEIRESDSRGRHTTTHRELVLLPDGGIIMDTPGMRTLILWEGDEGITEVFGDIEKLVDSCRFSDCTHNKEPGCAIRKAVQEGSLSEKRWMNWLKLQKELQYIDHKKSEKARHENKKNYDRKQKGKEVIGRW